MSSRPRNSTLLHGLIAALLALAALVAATGGVTIELGSLTLRSHSAWRVLVAAGAVIGIRAWMVSRSRRADSRSLIPDPVAIVLLTLTFLSIGYWFKYLLATVGGADSYGYASAAQLLASGRLTDVPPMAEWLSSPNRLALTSPLGWAPSAVPGSIAPAYPLGFPALMAIFSTVAGSNAIFYVSPAMGLLTLWLVYRLARSWGDEYTALLATALVAWNPVFLTYAKQPMSDVAATAWLMLAVYLALEGRRIPDAAIAGIAAGAAFLTRPALLVAVAIIPLIAMRGPTPYKRLMAAGIGIAVAAVIRLAVQAHMFGNPFSTGYGSAEALFSWGAFPQNVDIYWRQSWRTLGGPWFVGLAAGIWLMRRRRDVAGLTAVAAAVALPYLFYIRFDHWETLRYLLPGLVPLSIVVACGVTQLAARLQLTTAAPVVLLVLAGVVAIKSERLMRTSSVWDIQNLEARYPLAGQWFAVNTPPQSVALASQHSGSLRWYGGRQTLRWDLMKPEELVPTVRELEAHGATAYAALEGTEQQSFDAKFSSELARLSVDAVGHIRNVNILRLKTPSAAAPTAGALRPN